MHARLLRRHQLKATFYMIYELAHFLKDKCSLLWDVAEWCNATLFSLLYGRKLTSIAAIITGVPPQFTLRLAQKNDLPSLDAFFKRQPSEAFRYFKPHKFDEQTLKRLLTNKSFIILLLTEHTGLTDEIVGYAFMRSFVNGSSYRGYMVDAGHRGQGLAKIMGYGMNTVGDKLILEMYKSISPKNVASMKATQTVCRTKLLRTLDNGDYLLKCTSRPHCQDNCSD